jgi:cytochrome bd-type quinol oxidase subunit 1
MDEIAEILGKMSLIVVVVAVATGVLMRHKRAALYKKIHRVVGFAVLALAVCHGLAIMLD